MRKLYMLVLQPRVSIQYVEVPNWRPAKIACPLTLLLGRKYLPSLDSQKCCRGSGQYMVTKRNLSTRSVLNSNEIDGADIQRTLE